MELVWADPDRPAWERLRRETLWTFDLYEAVLDLFPHSGDEMFNLDWEGHDGARKAVDSRFRSLLVEHMSEHPEQWDWDLLWEERFKERARIEGETAGDEEDPWWETPHSKEMLEPEHWFEHDDDYSDQVDSYLSSAPIPEDYLPQVSIWLEGTDVELVRKMETDMLLYWGEVYFDHPFAASLFEAASAVQEVADWYVIDDPEAIWSLLQRDHALAPHRAHISPSDLVTRKPAAGP